MGVFVKVWQLIKGHPDQPGRIGKYMEDYFRRSDTIKGRNPN